MAGKHISLLSPFKEGDPTEWFQRYEICCTANEWSEATQLVKLPALLEGDALAVWLELAPEDQRDYMTAKRKITAHMSPVRFVSLEDFHARRLLPGESLSVFVHQLKRILIQAMPTVDVGTQEQLLLHQFVAGLPGHVSKQLRAVGEIDDLDKVIERAKLLLTIDKRENIVAIETTRDGSTTATGIFSVGASCCFDHQTTEGEICYSAQMLQLSAAWPPSAQLPGAAKMLYLWTARARI